MSGEHTSHGVGNAKEGIMAEITWKSILTKLVGGDHLTAEESEWFVDDLMQGNANPAAVGAALAMWHEGARHTCRYTRGRKAGRSRHR